MRINGKKLVDGGFDGRAKWGDKSDHDLEVKLTITESDEERFHTDMTLDGDADAGLSGASALVVRVAGENVVDAAAAGAVKWGADPRDFELSTTLTNDGAELFDGRAGPTRFGRASWSGRSRWTVKPSTRTSTARATSRTKPGSSGGSRLAGEDTFDGSVSGSVEWDDCGADDDDDYWFNLSFDYCGDATVAFSLMEGAVERFDSTGTARRLGGR